jgi:hypothetical protein
MKCIRVVVCWEDGMVRDIMEVPIKHIKSGKFSAGTQWALDAGIKAMTQGYKVSLDIVDDKE